MARHFPQERPPVPAAPYVGGVEWDATNYLSSHLDLLNAILACTPGGRGARNALREQKYDEAYQEWVKDLRTKAFVEVREFGKS